MLAELLLKWPLIRQLRGGGDGTGAEAMSDRTNALRPKNEGASVARSICPYCAVGCGQLIYHRDGRIVSIEGDPQSPISRGHLCPKGANSYELVTHAGLVDEGEVPRAALEGVDRAATGASSRDDR